VGASTACGAPAPPARRAPPAGSPSHTL
jgi:hypothetical protein